MEQRRLFIAQICIASGMNCAGDSRIKDTYLDAREMARLEGMERERAAAEARFNEAQQKANDDFEV